MAGPIEIEVEIDAAGHVEVHVKGAPGRACLDYRDRIVRALGGSVVREQATAELNAVGTSATTARQDVRRRV